MTRSRAEALAAIEAGLEPAAVLLQTNDPLLYRAYCVGYGKAEQGLAALVSALRQAEADADRYYRAMCARAPAPSKKLEQPSFAEMSRRRGDLALEERALERAQANFQFGRGAA